MTAKGFGALALLDGAERLIGISTDGRFCGGLLRANSFWRSRLMTFMHPVIPNSNCPRTSGSQKPGVLHSSQIQRGVCCQDDKAVGILHLHDLLAHWCGVTHFFNILSVF